MKKTDSKDDEHQEITDQVAEKILDFMESMDGYHPALIGFLMIELATKMLMETVPNNLTGVKAALRGFEAGLGPCCDCGTVLDEPSTQEGSDE